MKGPSSLEAAVRLAALIAICAAIAMALISPANAAEYNVITVDMSCDRYRVDIGPGDGSRHAVSIKADNVTVVGSSVRYVQWFSWANQWPKANKKVHRLDVFLDGERHTYRIKC